MKVLTFPWKEMLWPSKSDNTMALSLMVSSICLANHYVHINAEKISDCVTFYLQKVIPMKLQNLFRDSGAMNVICDYGAYMVAVLMAKSDLQAALDFWNIGKQLQIFQYGSTNEHILEVFQPLDSSIYHRKDNKNNVITYKQSYKNQYDTLVFVHGGAWGCGRPWHYRLVANGLGLLLGVKTVILIGYPTYPTSTILMQRDYITQAMQYINTNITLKTLLNNNHYNKNNSIILAGHSSGANICALSLLDTITTDNFTDTKQLSSQNSLNIKTFIGFCGPYDIGKHYLFETNRGVHIISPMCAAAGGRKCFNMCSPTSVAKNLSRKYAYLLTQQQEQLKLLQDKEQNIEKVDISNSSDSNNTTNKNELISGKGESSQTPAGILGMPNMILLHGTKDMVVPYSSSEELASTLREINLQVELLSVPVSIVVLLLYCIIV